MQTITSVLMIAPEDQRWVTSMGVETTEPVIYIGTLVRLLIDMRTERTSEEQAPPAFPSAQLSDVASWYLAVDADFNQSTAPIMYKTSGISLTSTSTKTTLAVDLPNTDSAAMRTALSTNKSVVLTLEIGGLDSNGNVVVCLQCPIQVKNRVWISGTVPQEVASDPEYYTSSQVTSLVNSAVATAVASAISGITGAQGATGPAPTITMGSVTTGATPGATLVAGANDSYSLNLVLPEADDGTTPAFSMGSVTTGATPGATLTEVEGGYKLNLVLPAGASMSPKGNWNAATTYAANDTVRHNSASWVSVAGNNTGHEPSGDSTYWNLMVQDGAGMEYRYSASASGPWHSTLTSGDLYYAMSTDGGATWSIAVALSQPAISIVFRFNPDSVSDWVTPVAGTSYSTATGQYLRLTTSLGTVSEAYDMTNNGGTADIRLQFADDGESWHPTLMSTDTKVRIFTSDNVLQRLISFNLPAGVTPVAVHVSKYQNPWHAAYTAGDRWYKISQDGGLSWSEPIPVCLDEAPNDGKVYARSNNAWVEISTASESSQTSSAASVYAIGVNDLPEHSERRIWDYLTFPRPTDDRVLHICWQTSSDGSTWSRELNSVDNGSQAFMHSAGIVTQFNAANAQDACLKMEHIAPCNCHVRLCWAVLDANNELHKGEWIYRNTLGVLLSLEGEAYERPVHLNPEYFVIPIPEDAEQCAIQLSASGEWYGEQYWCTDRHFSPNSSASMFFFDGLNLIENTLANEQTFPTSFIGPATAGQWLVFRRRGIPKYHIRAVWTGATPAVYTWSPTEED